MARMAISECEKAYQLAQMAAEPILCAQALSMLSLVLSRMGQGIQALRAAQVKPLVSFPCFCAYCLSCGAFHLIFSVCG